MSKHNFKQDFPIFQKHQELVYLDSAATSQKPGTVIKAVADFYTNKNANVLRGIYQLAEDSTQAYEDARDKAKHLLNASEPGELIFVRNTTEAVNLVARSFLPKTGRILLSQAEHHSNIVPWQLVRGVVTDKKVARVRDIAMINLTDDYRLDLKDYKQQLSQGDVKLVSVAHASNVLGTVNPVKEITALAHEAGARVLIDGAQAVAHLPIDVQELDADFYVFSGHKMLGPTGIGVLYAKQKLLEHMPPLLGGGGMIEQVYLEQTNWNELPHKFESGTVNVAGAVGLGAAIDYLNLVGFAAIKKQELELGSYALERLNTVPDLEIYGPPTMENRLAVFAFTLDKVHAHDVASLLDEQHIAVRAGHHCTMPLHKKVIKKPATVRSSLYIYNTKEDIDRLVAGLKKINKIMK